METRIRRYLDILASLGESSGDWRKGEIQIVSESPAIVEHERELEMEVGLMYEDRYVILLRDPVLFPPRSGETAPRRGTYIRLVYKQNLKGNPSVFLLTVDREGRLVLNRSYEHAVRGWTLSGQGTIARDGESLDDSIARCLRDELGVTEPLSRELVTDGFISERGLLGCRVPIYLVRIEAAPQGPVADDKTAGHLAVEPLEYLQALPSGTFEIDGVPHQLHESYTTTAVFLAMLKGLV